MKKRKIYLVVIAGMTMLVFSWLISYYLLKKPNILIGKPVKPLIIPPGISFKALQDSLYQQGYVKDITSFSLLARLLKYNRRVMPGAYKLQPGMSNWQAIQLLRRGIQVPLKTVLHNVHSKADLAAKITKNIRMGSTDFEKLLNDSAFVSQYGLNTENILVMFIPNTYELYWTISPKALFQRMYLEYQKFWNPARLYKAKQMQLSPIEVTILASVVAKETNNLEEASMIAGVYLNRLQKGMRLQSCPTLLYIVGDRSGKRVLHKYQHIDSPYNTYLHPGIPPGPITIPSIAMIEAVLNYRQHKYFYFSAKEDFSGHHYFSKSFSEHKDNGRRYRQALTKKGIYR